MNDSDKNISRCEEFVAVAQQGNGGPSKGYRQLGASARWARGLMAVGILAIFAGARALHPAEGGFGTHVELGLPPCAMVRFFGVRCPSCGMTTSWAHLARGQLREALKASVSGTCLGLGMMGGFVLCLVTAVTGRRENWDALTVINVAMICLIVLMIVEWSIRLFLVG